MKWVVSFVSAALAAQLSSGQQGPDRGDLTQLPAVAETMYRYDGAVTAVTAESITLQAEGEAPRQFRLSPVLRAGRFPATVSAYQYRVIDIRVGDRIAIHASRRGGEDVCDALSISRRPGGRVPPSPTDDPTALFKHHERQQAHQDWEERGIPFPDKYCPPWARVPVAPMPREKDPPAIPRAAS